MSQARAALQFAISHASQTGLGYRLAFMPNKMLPEVPRQAFVQQDLHPILVKSESLAVSSASMAI